MAVKLPMSNTSNSLSLTRRSNLLTLLATTAVFSVVIFIIRINAENLGFRNAFRGLNCDSPARRGNLIVDIGLHVDTAEGWRVRQVNHLAQSKSQIHYGPDPGDHGFNWGGNRSLGNVYFQDNWEPTFSCGHEKRIGHWGDGGKWICNPERIPRPAVVYSLGSNDEFSFEEAIHDYFDGDVEIHTFDAGDAPSKPSYVTYHKNFIGIDREENNISYKSIPTILSELGHTRIDVMKIDIEGNEMRALLPLLESGLWSNAIKQIQIEIHLYPSNFPDVTAEDVDKFFKILSNKYHMEIFHKEPNIKFGGGIATEMALVYVDWDKAMSMAGVECSNS